jgi:hypothetical protein
VLTCYARKRNRTTPKKSSYDFYECAKFILVLGKFLETFFPPAVRKSWLEEVGGEHSHLSKKTRQDEDVGGDHKRSRQDEEVGGDYKRSRLANSPEAKMPGHLGKKTRQDEKVGGDEKRPKLESSPEPDLLQLFSLVLSIKLSGGGAKNVSFSS